METVGFIGLGNMGGGMSANIQRAGYQLVVYDLREEVAKPLLEGGARLANSPAEVARLPRGVTWTMTGMSVFSMALMMSRVASRSPPGVSISIRMAVALSASAFFTPALT